MFKDRLNKHLQEEPSALYEESSILGNPELNILKEQKMLQGKINHVCSVLILHQVSVYSPCWRPITDTVKLLWKLKGIHTSIANDLQAQLHHEPGLHVSSLMRRQGMVEIIYRKELSAFLLMLSAVNRDKTTKITDMALGKMILKVFPQTGCALQDGHNKSWCTKFRRVMAE